MRCLRWPLILLLACRTAPQEITQKDIVSISPASGAVSARLVADPNAPTAHLAPGEEFVAPLLRPENPPPTYPPDLIPLHLGPHTVSLRLTFDEDGKAWKIEPSPVAKSTDDQYRAAFEAALAETLMRWKCQPARIRTFRAGPDSDSDGKPDFRVMTSQRPLKTFYDLSFTFEVVNGQPVVRSAASPK